MDGIRPYRLEMGQKLPDSSTLYSFWKEKIIHEIYTQIKEWKNPVILNVASLEYFKSIDIELLKNQKGLKKNIRIVTCVFKDDGKIKSVFAKKARGVRSIRYFYKKIYY